MHSLSSLAELLGTSREPADWHIRIAPLDTERTKLLPAELSAIADHPEVSALTVMGLHQAEFETLVRTYGAQFTGIQFWKCPRIADLSPLEDLPGLTHVSFYWNQLAPRLWDFRRTPALRGLQFQDFTRLHDLSDLRLATSLEELYFGDMIWPQSVIESLVPLESLEQLRILALNAKRIEDGRVQPLAKLQRLESLEFPPNQFTTRQVAWLRARLPDSVQSSTLTPVKMFAGFGEGAKRRDALVIGKRKPWLNSARDAKRVERYVAEFWQMVEEFRRDPEAQPD